MQTGLTAADSTHPSGGHGAEMQPAGDFWDTTSTEVARGKLTDDQILGLVEAETNGTDEPRPGLPEDGSKEEAGKSQTANGEEAGRDSRGEGQEGRQDEGQLTPELRTMMDRHPELKRAWEDERAYRAIFPSVEEAREMRVIFPTIEDARAAGQQAGELRNLDALFLANQPETHAALAAQAYRMNPGAFRGLVHMMSTALEQWEGPGRAGREAPGAMNDGGKANPAAADSSARGMTGEQKHAAEAEQAAMGRGESASPGWQGLVMQEANTAAVRTVLGDIKEQVEKLLPPDFGEGARNRVIGEIYREVDAKLSNQHAMAQQIRLALQSGRPDAKMVNSLVSLVVGRARQALPAAARKVISEWTTGVLGAQRQRASRQRAAESRVDFTGATRGDGGRRKPLMPKDVNYRQMSDSDILNL